MEEEAFQSRQELLTKQFYEWEMRGRGWVVWDAPVELEPPFRPFRYHWMPPAPRVDDGKRSTFLGALIKKAKASLSEAKTENIDNDPVEEYDDTPTVIEDYPEIVELAVALPADQVIAPDMTEQFFLSFNYTNYPITLEIIGLSDHISLQMTCREPDVSRLKQQIQSFFPSSVITKQTGYLEQHWNNSGNRQSVVVDFGLSNEFMLPLQTYSDFGVDPMIAVIGALGELNTGEIGILQIIFQAVKYPWAENAIRAVTDGNGKAFFQDSPSMLPLAKKKMERPLFAAVIRIGAKSKRQNRSWQIAKVLGGALNQFSSPISNELVPLANEYYPDDVHEKDLLLRLSHRSGMILNSEELSSLAHFPSASVRSEKFVRDERRTKAAPSLTFGHQTILGENLHNSKTSQISLSANQRTQHTYVIGASGTGKSTLLLNMIIQDIKNGEGVGVLDPHGDLIDKILGHIPEDRFNDVILFDPSDEDYPIGFNILSAHSEQEKTLLSSDLVAGFRRLASTTWGDQMTSVLGNAILAFLESEKGGTLSDLRRFLVEKEFRQTFLETVRDNEVVYYWQREFPLLVGKPQGPILTRLDTFLRPKLIRHMICQKENRLDFRKIMDGKKIFLAKLSQGAIGEENSYLLGTLLVSKIHQMIMGRQDLTESKRQNFYLYIDEFHNFITPSMASILSGARKYRLGLILAHQELRQLWNKDTDVASAVISNPYTRICFRCGDFDAQKLKEGFSFFEAKDLQNLGTGQAIVRIEKAEYDFNLKTYPSVEIDAGMARTRTEQITALSRATYASKRDEVEKIQIVEVKLGVDIAKPEKKVSAQNIKPDELPGREVVVQEKTSNIVIPFPGRGGEQHKFLQQLIKRAGEDRGYQAIIEKVILDGAGSVDVSLEKKERKIACEISITTDEKHELVNIQKCLAASYDQVVIVSSDKKALNKIKNLATNEIGPDLLKKVRFLLPEEMFAFLGATEVRAVTGDPTIPENKDILTAKELEDLLKIDVKTIYSYVQKGILPYVKIQSNLRFIRSEILSWMAEHKFKPKSKASKK